MAALTQSFGQARAGGALTPRAAALLPARHLDVRSRATAVDDGARRGIHPAARDALRRDAAVLPVTAARDRALTALDAPRLATVVTGQQVGLFVGPLYSLWKAATAVAWAARLERETGIPVVPVFWLQTEDHDIDEVAHCTVTDQAGGVHVTRVTADGEGDRVSIAHRSLGDDAVVAIDRVQALLHRLPHAEATIALLRDTWRPGAHWATAFARVLGHVFAETPLLVLQPRTPALAAAAAPVHRWAVEQHEAIARALTDRGEALREVGFDEQVPARTDCALGFFHASGPAGPRYRLRRVGTAWHLADGTDRDVTRDVTDALERDPLRFSSSALLRPLVQDALLPTAAYVGGPGEVSYLAQLPPLYALRDTPMPLVVPRASGVVLDADAARDARALALRPADVSGDVEAVLERLGPPSDTPRFTGLATRARAAVDDALAIHRSAAERLDPDVVSAFEKTAENVERSLSKLERRLERAALHADPERVAAARRLVARLRPGGTPQDRTLCWPDLAARLGVDAIGPLLLRAVIDAVEAGHDGQDLEVTT